MLAKIRERDAGFPAIRDADGKIILTDGYHRSGYDRRWLLQRVTEMETALTNLYYAGVTGKVDLVGLALAKAALAALKEAEDSRG